MLLQPWFWKRNQERYRGHTIKKKFSVKYILSHLTADDQETVNMYEGIKPDRLKDTRVAVKIKSTFKKKAYTWLGVFLKVAVGSKIFLPKDKKTLLYLVQLKNEGVSEVITTLKFV